MTDTLSDWLQKELRHGKLIVRSHVSRGGRTSSRGLQVVTMTGSREDGDQPIGLVDLGDGETSVVRYQFSFKVMSSDGLEAQAADVLRQWPPMWRHAQTHLATISFADGQRQPNGNLPLTVNLARLQGAVIGYLQTADMTEAERAFLATIEHRLGVLIFGNLSTAQSLFQIS